MVEYLNWLKRTCTKTMFENILKAAEDDIKFNRVNFGKCTNQEEFITICKMCHTALLRTGV